jgi:hypothetical protein
MNADIEILISEIKMTNEAMDFVIKELSQSKSLSDHIMKVLREKRIEIYALVPANIVNQRLYAFETGGLGHTNSREYFLFTLEKFIMGNNYGIIIFDDWIKNKNDPYFKNHEIENMITYRDEVYFYVKDAPRANELILSSRRSLSGYPTLIYLINVKEKFLNHNLTKQLSKNDIKFLSKNIQEIFVSAYDNESYLREKIL